MQSFILHLPMDTKCTIGWAVISVYLRQRDVCKVYYMYCSKCVPISGWMGFKIIEMLIVWFCFYIASSLVRINKVYDQVLSAGTYVTIIMNEYLIIIHMLSFCKFWLVTHQLR